MNSQPEPPTDPRQLTHAIARKVRRMTNPEAPEVPIPKELTQPKLAKGSRASVTQKTQRRRTKFPITPDLEKLPFDITDTTLVSIPRKDNGITRLREAKTKTVRPTEALTLTEIATRFGLHRTSVWKWTKLDQGLKTYKVNKRVYTTEMELALFLSRYFPDSLPKPDEVVHSVLVSKYDVKPFEPEMTLQEIADELGLTLRVVEYTLHRALTKLLRAAEKRRLKDFLQD